MGVIDRVDDRAAAGARLVAVRGAGLTALAALRRAVLSAG